MGDCENCGNGLATVPYAAFEAQQARHQKTVRNFIIAIIIMAFMIFASNLAWLWYINQYDFESTSEEITVDAKDGIANYIGEDGDIYNGEDSCQKAN